MEHGTLHLPTGNIYNDFEKLIEEVRNPHFTDVYMKVSASDLDKSGKAVNEFLSLIQPEFTDMYIETYDNKGNMVDKKPLDFDVLSDELASGDSIDVHGVKQGHCDC